MQYFHTFSTTFKSMFDESTFPPNFQQAQVSCFISIRASGSSSTVLHICAQISPENLQAVHNRKGR